MSKLLPQYKRSTVYALIGVIFHFVVVVLPMIIFVGFVEQRAIQRVLGYWVYLVDFPLIFIETKVRAILSSIFSPKVALILFFSLPGTFLYLLVGWFVGNVTDKFLQWRLKKWGF